MRDGNEKKMSNQKYTSNEFEFAKKFQFVSCWTEELKESIPQWSTYSNDMRRIRKGIEIDEEDLSQLFILEEDSIIKNKLPLSYLSKRRYHGCVIMDAHSVEK
ncbi:hypothetical protein [Facklamia hominis]